jgi:hypothetical protein
MQPQPKPLLESPAEFISIGRYDWYVSKSWNRLHWAEIGNEYHAGIAMDWAVTEPIRLACGRMAEGLWIPGMFSRMGAMRCTGCCRALGYPQGKGSPKNDDACRVLLGLPADGGAAAERVRSEIAATG